MKIIRLNYKLTGIKTLRGISLTMLILGVIAFVILFISGFTSDVSAIFQGFPYLFSGIFLYAFGNVVATIGESMLYNKMYLIEKAKSEDIVFEESTPAKRNTDTYRIGSSIRKR